MKIVIRVVLLFGIVCFSNCKGPNQDKLLKKNTVFSISECQEAYNNQSDGVKSNYIKNKKLFIRLAYTANCSWENGYLSDLKKYNDTLLIELDQLYRTDTLSDGSIENGYPITQCDCFFYFDLEIDHVKQAPKTVLITSIYEKDRYWDENNVYEIEEVEDIENE